MTPMDANRKLLRRRLSQYGEQSLRRLLSLQKADHCSKGVVGEAEDFSQIDALLEEILAEDACLTISRLSINGHDLMEMGLTGPAIGNCLNALLRMVVDEQIPNEKAALLAAARRLNL